MRDVPLFSLWLRGLDRLPDHCARVGLGVVERSTRKACCLAYCTCVLCGLREETMSDVRLSSLWLCGLDRLSGHEARERHSWSGFHPGPGDGKLGL